MNEDNVARRPGRAREPRQCLRPSPVGVRAVNVWTSSTGIAMPDLVPISLRRRWVELGWCPDRDIYAVFSEHVRACPDTPAVIDPAGTLTYTGLDTLVRRIAAALSESGLGEGDIVGIQVPNGWQAAVAELAVAAVGATALPYPAGRGRRDSLHLLGRSGATGVITVQTAGTVPLAANLAALRPALPDLRAVFTFGTAPPGCLPLEPWLADAEAGRRWRDAPVDPEAPARILVSSGSEAEPKMVAYSHNAMVGGRGNYVLAVHGRPERMRSLVLVALSSAYGSLGTSVTLARHGGTLLLLDGFDAARALRMMVEQHPNLVFGVPTMLRRMAELPRLPGEDPSSAPTLVSSAAPLDRSTIQACRERFGCPVINIYGSADGVNCHTVLGDGAVAHAGRPDPAVAQICVAGPSGEPVPDGEEGEIWALGPMTPLCYVNAPELDRRYRAPGGWVRTGDLGLIDGEGRLHVVDRMKRIISRGGYKISPAELEQELCAHPAVAEAACVAVPDDELGERLCACLVTRPGAPAVTLGELSTFLENECGLERRKLPELLLTLPELPRSPSGKVCAQTLARLAGVHSASSAP